MPSCTWNVAAASGQRRGRNLDSEATATCMERSRRIASLDDQGRRAEGSSPAPDPPGTRTVSSAPAFARFNMPSAVVHAVHREAIPSRRAALMAGSPCISDRTGNGSGSRPPSSVTMRMSCSRYPPAPGHPSGTAIIGSIETAIPGASTVSKSSCSSSRPRGHRGGKASRTNALMRIVAAHVSTRLASGRAASSFA